jgi:GNAT superfamily N-acetyltransferase
MIPDRVAASLWAAFLRNRNVDAGTAGDGAIPVAGGYAIYVAGTLFDYAIGAGTTRPLRDDDLAVVEEFYAARSHAARFELGEEILARDGDLLRGHGYVAEDDLLAILEGPIRPGAAPAPAGRIVVRPTTDRRGWAELATRAFGDGGTEPALLLRTMQAQAAAAHAMFIASLDGRDVGVGGLTVYGDLALLSSAGVLPAFRGQGVHNALVAARLGAAHTLGAVQAAIKTAPGSPVERSAAHFGIVRTGLRRRVRRAAA